MTHVLQRKTLLALALCVPLLAPALARAADTFELDSIDLISSGDRTNIILHTGSILPYRKVMVSSNKVILDFDRVSADDTVRTNFQGAANISHVILKPLNDHEMRLIIRGQNLGAPTVAFNNPLAEAPAGEALAEQTGLALHAVQEEGMQPAALTGTDAGAVAPATDIAETAPDEAIDVTAVDTEALPVPGEPETLAAEAPLNNPNLEAPQARAAEPVPIPALEAETAELSGGNTISRFFDALLAGHFNQWIPYGLLALLLAGVGWFIKRKVDQLNAEQPSLEDLIAEQSQGKRVSFRELADAYRQQEEVRQTAAPARKTPATPSNSKARTASRPSGELIGLSRLKNAPAPELQAEASQQAAYLENLMASATKPPKPAPAPKKQALNQYQRAQVPAPKTAPKAPAVKPAVFPKAKKPGISSPQNPINRAPAAKAKAGGQNPLPGNPEVLDFLRNVADLMEKEGKSDLARSIQKNLRTT